MRRGQAAMEFILTYGWAILAVIVGIGALAYFGVFSSNIQSERCLFSSGITCKEFAVSTRTATYDNVTLYLQNDVGEAITITAINLTGDNKVGTCTPQTVDISSDNKQRFECRFNKFSAKTVKLQSTVKYKKVLGDYNHTIPGEIVVNTN